MAKQNERKERLITLLCMSVAISLLSYYFKIQCDYNYNTARAAFAENDLQFNSIVGKLKTRLVELRLNSGIPKGIEDDIDSVIYLSHNYISRVKGTAAYEFTYGNPKLLYDKLNEIKLQYDEYYWEALGWSKEPRKFRALDKLELDLLIHVDRFLYDYLALDNRSTFLSSNLYISDQNSTVFMVICLVSILEIMFALTSLVIIRKKKDAAKVRSDVGM